MQSLKTTMILLMLLLLTAACVSNDSSDTTTEEPIQQEKPVVAFSHKSVNPYVYLIMNEAMKKAVESRGWTYMGAIADQDQTRQNQQIMNFIKQSPDAIVINPMDSDGINEVVDYGTEQGIPMCTIDNHATSDNITIEVSFDNYLAGVMAANAIVKELAEKYGEPKGTVFNGYGALNSKAWRLRKDGFESVMAKYPEVNYLAVATEGETERVKNELMTLLEAGVAIDAVHTPSEHYGRGAVEALKETDNWFAKEEEGHVVFVSIDGEPYFVDLIQSGYVDGAVAQDVIAYGFITAELLNEHVFKGKPFVSGEYLSKTTHWKSYLLTAEGNHATVVIPPYLIDEENCNEKTHWSYKAEELWGFQFNR